MKVLLLQTIQFSQQTKFVNAIMSNSLASQPTEIKQFISFGGVEALLDLLELDSLPLDFATTFACNSIINLALNCLVCFNCFDFISCICLVTINVKVSNVTV